VTHYGAPYGACPECGCAWEECEGEIVHSPRPTPPRAKQGVKFRRGDWVRVKSDHHLAGATGVVQNVDRSVVPALCTVRQLNGFELRLPLGHFRFVAYDLSDVDVL
jgi:hypothetical protein